MDEKYERGILRLSAVFIIAAILLIPPGFLELSPSPVLVGAFLALAAALFAAWQSSDDYSRYLSGLWLGPAIAAVVTVAAITIGASPGELQALGGVTGLVGVFNLLLRPVYRLVH